MMDITGGIRLSQEWTIDAREMGTWEPERITQFFEGIAAMIRAHGANTLLRLTYRPDLVPPEEVR
jgi:hypothetical protein